MPNLADLLVDFGKPARRERVLPDGGGFSLPQDGLDVSSLDAFDLPDGETDAGTFEFEATGEAPDVEAIVAEAVAKAEADLTRRLEEGFAATLETERETHQQALERLRRDIGEKAGAAISEQLAGIEERLTNYTSEVVARLLGPVLTDSLQQKTVRDLSDIIGESIRESGAVRIRVRGPLSLFEALESAVGEHSGRLEYTETESFDLEVSIDESLYETRLSEWSQSLSEALQ